MQTHGQLIIRVEVTTPAGRHLISRSPLRVAQVQYAECDGYRVREVAGWDTEQGFLYHPDSLYPAVTR